MPNLEAEAKSLAKLLVRSSLEHNQRWREVPVSSKEFFEKYLNEPCYPKQQAFIDAMLGTDPLKWDTTFQEGIALVGKGGGKDRTIAKLLLYIVYLLMCMENPQLQFAQGEGDSIDLINISLNAKLAKKVFFKNFVWFIKKCRYPAEAGQRDHQRKNWFVEHGLNLADDILDREVKFPNGITCHSLDSTEYSFEGLNVMVVVFDEVGGFIPDRAKDIYNAVTDTQVSRFGDNRKTVLISFPRNVNDFMMVRYHEAQSEPKTYHDRAATWDWNPRRSKASFADKYTKNPENARRVYECICDTSEGGYFKYKEQLQFVFKNGEALNPIVGDYVILKSLKVIQFKPFFVPDPNAFYFIHVDTAKGKEGGDAAGFAMCHYVPRMKPLISDEHIKKLFSLEGIDISNFKEKESLGIEVDLYFQVRAPKGGEIIFDDILEFIVNMKRGLKFNIKHVGFDGYQSLNLIQNLKRAGIESGEISVDRSNDAYDNLKSVIYRGVLSTYPNFVVLREIEELLITDKGKIDHPAESFRRAAEEGDNKGSKDVADALAGAVHKCLEELPPEFKVWFSGHTIKGQQDAGADLQRSEQEKLVRYGQRPR